MDEGSVSDSNTNKTRKAGLTSHNLEQLNFKAQKGVSRPIGSTTNSRSANRNRKNPEFRIGMSKMVEPEGKAVSIIFKASNKEQDDQAPKAKTKLSL